MTKKKVKIPVDMIVLVIVTGFVISVKVDNAQMNAHVMKTVSVIARKVKVNLPVQ